LTGLLKDIVRAPALEAADRWLETLGKVVPVPTEDGLVECLGQVLRQVA
jgi:hypothetical protein